MTPDFRRLERNLIKAIEGAKQDGVRAIGEKAKDLCPKDTGKTADNIKVDPEKGTVGGDYYTIFWLELGTENMPAHPFLRPAFDHGVRPMMRGVKDAINDVLGG